MAAYPYELVARLRAQARSIRTKPTPLADLIPLLQQAADAIESAWSEGAPAEGVKVLNALDVLERAALGPHSQGTAEQFLRCLGEGGMLVIEHPLLAASPSEGSAGDAPTPSVTDSRCNYVAFASRVCNKCGQQHDGGGSPWPGIIDIDAPEFQLRQPGEHENLEDEAAVDTPASPAGTAVPGMTQEKN